MVNRCSHRRPWTELRRSEVLAGCLACVLTGVVSSPWLRRFGVVVAVVSFVSSWRVNASAGGIGRACSRQPLFRGTGRDELELKAGNWKLGRDSVQQI